MDVTPIGILAIFLTISGCTDREANTPVRAANGKMESGRALIKQFGCGACHDIPGIPQARGSVGPSLKNFRNRNLIAGRFPNRTGELTMWVRNAPALDPQTAMPPMPMSDREAADVVSYLYSLDGG